MDFKGPTTACKVPRRVREKRRSEEGRVRADSAAQREKTLYLGKKDVGGRSVWETRRGSSFSKRPPKKKRRSPSAARVLRPSKVHTSRIL